MVKASITLPNGTEVTVDGSPEEVQSLLEFYGNGAATKSTPPAPTRSKPNKKNARTKPQTTNSGDSDTIDVAKIVNLVKNCDEAESIETQILDRASQVDRVLLPMYIVHEHQGNAFRLSSGDIARITRDLGVPVAQSNASRTLTGIASKYVMADGVRKKGTKLTYKLSRRGLTYMHGVIAGRANED